MPNRKMHTQLNSDCIDAFYAAKNSSDPWMLDDCLHYTLDTVGTDPLELNMLFPIE